MFSRRTHSSSSSEQRLTRIIEISRGKSGYGFTLSGQAPCFVSWIVKSSPAEQIGLSVGDYVISVNGTDVSSSTHEAVVKLIGVSSGTLFLGLSKTLDGISPRNDSALPIRKNSIEEASDTVPRFSRAEKVLKDLYSGALFKSMATPPPISKEVRKVDEHKPCRVDSPSLIGVPCMIMMQSVVAYLGTVEMPFIDSTMIQQASLEAIRSCVQQLRVEQHIHQRVLMKITQSCVKLFNADGDNIAIYKSEKLRFSTACPDDTRFFCLVTVQENQTQTPSSDKHSCHIFMVDPEISMHSSHDDKAKRFGIQCSTNNDTGDCVEFPKTPRSLLAVIRLLYMTSSDHSAKCVLKQDGKRNTSIISSSTNDSGIVDQSDTFSTPQVHVVDYRQLAHANLTRGESSLPPCARIAWSNSGDKRTVSERRNSSGGADDASRLSPRALFGSEMSDSVSQTLARGSISRSSSGSNSLGRQRGTLSHHKLHAESVSVTKETQHSNAVPLSQQNLLRHNHRMRQSIQNTNNNSHVPPPMHKLSMGKYKIPDIRRTSASLDRHQIRKLEADKRTHQKRNPRLFPGRFINRGKPISRSTENVAASDEDALSGASSVESLASNASLPSCINGSLSGNFEYHGYQRSSLRASGSADANDVAAGRISHWAVSFERLLDDPLGVKYFKEFLCKEFSEENILFWEACENLRRSPHADTDKLKEQILDIYNRFLGMDAIMPINIDSQGQQLAEEALTATPHPDIFLNQQHQVYTLMRLDSYSRFLKSSLYRQCMVCEMEGRPLPLDVSEWSNSDQSSLDAQSNAASRVTSQSLDTGSLQRKSKKSTKGSKKGIFGFKTRSKRENKTLGSSLSRQSSRDSSGSESGLTNPSPLTRNGTLPSSLPEFPDPSRVCHVTLWDHTSTVLCAKKSGTTTVAEALGTLCENRGVRLSSLDVFLLDDYSGNGDGKQRRPLSLDLDVSVLASQSIVLERRSLFRLDMLPVKRSVGVKARPTKSIAEVLRPVLSKYNLHLDDLQIKNSVEETDLLLHQPVSTLDGLRIIVENKTDSTVKKDEIVKNKSQKDRCHDGKGLPRKSTLRVSQPDAKETEELIRLMAALQSSKLHDQRGLLTKADLELPEFLKIKPINNNNSNNNVTATYVYDAITDNVTSSPTDQSSSDLSPYAVSSVVCPQPVTPISTAPTGHQPQSRVPTSGSHRHTKPQENNSKCYVELSAQPKAMSSFKPVALQRKTTADRLTPDPCDMDDNDTTIVEDPDALVGSGTFDPDATLKPLPTPPSPHLRGSDSDELLKLPMADFSPPTPLPGKSKSTIPDDTTIMV